MNRPRSRVKGLGCPEGPSVAHASLGSMGVSAGKANNVEHFLVPEWPPRSGTRLLDPFLGACSVLGPECGNP